MSRDYLKYVKFLAGKYSVLYIGDDSSFLDDELSSLSTFLQVDANDSVLDELEGILLVSEIRVVIINIFADVAKMEEIFKRVKEYDENLYVMVIFDLELSRELYELLPFVDSIVTYPVNKAIFYEKLFSLLSICYSLDAISRRDIVLKSKNATELDEESFYDLYAGSVMFIVNDLSDIIISLDSGEMSKQFLVSISDKLEEVVDIFSKSSKTESIVPIFKELIFFLKELELEKIEPKNLKGFSYLSNILNDINIYLSDIFIDRILKNVYIFEHSLQDNIEFMKNTFYPSEVGTKSELEFF